ncbi:MAG: sugar phosphate isomerase/epimerase family protein [Promethearchaeota archaeon]
MIGISIRANWDFDKILNSILNLNIDFCEIQLDNPIFKFQEYQSKAIRLIDRLYSTDLKLSFHLSFIDLNIASLDNKIRYYSSRILRKEINFVKKWKPLYIVVHTGKISDTFYTIPSIREKAHKQQIKTISELLKTSSSYSIPFAIENRQKSLTTGLIEKISDFQYYSRIFPSLYFLLDIGHLNTFYHDSNALIEDIEIICDFPIIGIHLSNNFGRDTHGNLEDGTILFTKLFSKVKNLRKKNLIIENKSLKDASKSLNFLNKIIEKT